MGPPPPVQPHQQRGVPALMRAAPSGIAAPGGSVLSLFSPTRGGGGAAGGDAGGVPDAAAALGGDEAISRRTRSKRPLGPAVELDPTELDRLLAAFDPDVEPLLDDDVYRQFLQVGWPDEGGSGWGAVGRAPL
jgi:hypothetical protein